MKSCTIAPRIWASMLSGAPKGPPASEVIRVTPVLTARICQVNQRTGSTAAPQTTSGTTRKVNGRTWPGAKTTAETTAVSRSCATTALRRWSRRSGAGVDLRNTGTTASRAAEWEAATLRAVLHGSPSVITATTRPATTPMPSPVASPVTSRRRKSSPVTSEGRARRPPSATQKASTSAALTTP